MRELSPEERKKLIFAARQNAWDRGCTCGTKPHAEVISVSPPRVDVGIEHLVGCPLWKNLPIDAIPGDVQPDALIEVSL